MTATPPNKINLPPSPTPREILYANAGYSDSPASSHRTNPNSISRQGHLPFQQQQQRRRSLRPSFSTNVTRGNRRVSGISTVHTLNGGLVGDDLKLPTLVPGIRPAYSTPLPVLPMVVLCIAMLSEMLSANLSVPFLLKMVEGFFLSSGREKNSETEAAVGLWTGNLVSVFFITQFLTSLLWSRIADRHGRRAVLIASLLGSAIALVTFGTSKSLPEAICIRLVQGIFAGAVGVFRGSIRDITDDTNASQAYSILGFMWGFGAVMGPIFGGQFESPAQNHPGTFLARIKLFQSFPYLLPTMMAGTVLVTGAILACFLSWDGGVRGGSRIALPIEKHEPMNQENGDGSPAPSSRTAVPSLRNKRSFRSPGLDENPASSPAPQQVGGRRDSRASLGTAYGYGGIRSKHPTLAARAALEAARRESAATYRYDEDELEETIEPRLNLAQRILLANEDNTFNINDLWVSAAVAQETAVFEDDDEEETQDGDEEDEDNDAAILNTPTSYAPTDSLAGSYGRRQGRGRVTSGPLRPHRLSMARKFSTSSGQLPAIFGNTGLTELPSGIALDTTSPATSPQDPFFPPAARPGAPGGLGAIAEGRPDAHEGSPLVSPVIEVAEPAPQSAWRVLPLLMILEYGLLAFHNTTHDQIFLSFLVTPYKSGGLGLNPANFSTIIALMCFFQLFYQFYLYPRLGPPLGQFSHLQMFKIGCFIYIPAYLALPTLHAVASEGSSGNFFVMALVTIVTATRYCAGTLAYTSVMVLINAMSPPHVVSLANGLAQSVVSLSRFCGPVVGGSVWSASISGNPAGYSHPFYVVALLCFGQWALSFLIR